jgi:uncharacterized repeat protein (TIGR03803 family)
VAKGSQPKAALKRDSAGVLWGTTANGGALDLGTIFKFDPGTSAFTTVVEFTGTSGTAQGVGSARRVGGRWRRFSLGNNGWRRFRESRYRLQAGEANRRARDSCALHGRERKQSEGRASRGWRRNYWGTTNTGGANNQGTVFKVNATTGALATVVNLSGTGGLAKATFPFSGLADDGAGGFGVREARVEEMTSEPCSK